MAWLPAALVQSSDRVRAVYGLPIYLRRNCSDDFVKMTGHGLKTDIPVRSLAEHLLGSWLGDANEVIVFTLKGRRWYRIRNNKAGGDDKRNGWYLVTVQTASINLFPPTPGSIPPARAHPFGLFQRAALKDAPLVKHAICPYYFFLLQMLGWAPAHVCQLYGVRTYAYFTYGMKLSSLFWDFVTLLWVI